MTAADQHIGDRRGAGADGLHAGVPMMIAASERLLDAAEQIDSRYQSTRESVDDLLGRSWKGIAPDVHRELWSDWGQGFADVQSALKHMAAKISDAARHFNRQDSL